MPRFKAHLAPLAALLLLPAVAGSADRARLLDKETFFEMESVADPRISPDGRQIVFTRRWRDKRRDQQRANLWIVKSDGSSVRRLTEGDWSDSDPVWSPDGAKIAFISDRDETRQIFVLIVATREYTQLTHLTQRPSSLRWSPDGKRISFQQRLPDDARILPIKLPDKPKGAEWAKPATVIDRLNWRRDGIGTIDRGYDHIFAIDATLGGTPRQITQGDYDHREPEWTPDGQALLVSAIRKPDAEYARRDTEIYRIDAATGEVRDLTNRRGPDSDPKPSPDGQWIAYTGHDFVGEEYTRYLHHIYLMGSDGAGSRVWVDRLPSSPTSLHWAADSSGVYYCVEEQGSSNLYFAPRDLRPRKITEGGHVICTRSVSIAENGQVAAVRSTFDQPGDLVTFHVKQPAPIRSLVDVNADVLEGVQLGELEELWFSAPDGVRSQGWLIKPAVFESGKKYPLVLYIHGGPWSMYNVGFNWAWQNFAAEGYGVLYINPRGSTGYGQQFVDGIKYSYPGKDRDDLLAAVDAAVTKGWVDERNLFVCGGSGGGVLTAWLVGQTDRFRAAVAMRPVINWHSFVNTTDSVQSWNDQFHKRPWEDPLEYAERSPLRYAGNVTTPTMIMTGDADLRTPMGQSEEYYHALKLQRKDTLLVRMPGEYHGWRRPSHQLAQQLYLLAWFEKYRLKDDSDGLVHSASTAESESKP